jgi:hypothetical protein
VDIWDFCLKILEMCLSYVAWRQEHEKNNLKFFLHDQCPVRVKEDQKLWKIIKNRRKAVAQICLRFLTDYYKSFKINIHTCVLWCKLCPGECFKAQRTTRNQGSATATKKISRLKDSLSRETKEKPHFIEVLYIKISSYSHFKVFLLSVF